MVEKLGTMLAVARPMLHTKATFMKKVAGPMLGLQVMLRATMASMLASFQHYYCELNSLLLFVVLNNFLSATLNYIKLLVHL